MDIFAILLGIMLVMVSGLMVGLPLANSPNRQYDDYQASSLNSESLTKKKEALFAMLNEIEFDYRTNKLSQEDYQLLQNKYKPQAVAILKEEEKTKQHENLDRKGLEAEVEAEIEREVAALLQKKS